MTFLHSIVDLARFEREEGTLRLEGRVSEHLDGLGRRYVAHVTLAETTTAGERLRVLERSASLVTADLVEAHTFFDDQVACFVGEFPTRGEG